MSEINRPDWRHDVLCLVHALVRRRLVIATVMLAAAGFGVLAIQRADPFYEASSTFVLLPREKPVLDLAVQSASVESVEDSAKRSTAATLTLPPNPELYTTLIRSAQVRSRVAEAIGSDQAVVRHDLPGPAAIKAGLTVESSEEGVIRIAMKHHSPSVAATVVNLLVAECESASKEIERKMILQQAGFLGEAIDRADDRLQETRAELARFSDLIGVANPGLESARSAALIRTMDDTEARLEREVRGYLVHRTEADPAVAALLGELSQVRERRDEVRASYCGDLSEQEFAAVESEWRALAQDVTLRQDLLMTMRARHDVFSIRANQPAGNLAVIRAATPPSTPAGPSKRRIMVLALLGGLFVACALCVVIEQIELAWAREDTRELLTSIMGGLGWKSRAPSAGRRAVGQP